MKLRIRGNSLRLRLGPSEVARLATAGRIEEAVAFGPGQPLVYALEASGDATEPRASFADNVLLVRLPRAAVETWARTEQVGIAGEQPLGGDVSQGTLRLLVEKDFECLDRAPEEGEEAFPHPLRGSACAPPNPS